MRDVKILATMILCALCATARAEDPATAFEKLFGADMRRAQASPDPRDNESLAKKLIELAGASTSDRGLQALLYNKAYEVAAAAPQTHELAIIAMEALAKAQPQLKDEVEAKVLLVMERKCGLTQGVQRPAVAETYVARTLDYAAARMSAGAFEDAANACRHCLQAVGVIVPNRREALLAKIREAEGRASVAKSIEGLRSRLDREPDNTKAAEQLAVLLLVEMDDPQAASAYAKKAGDETLAKVVQLAADDPAALAVADALLLADWYRAQADHASDAGKPIAWSRAKACYDRFLAAYGKKDLTWLEAEAGARKAAEMLDQVGGAPDRKAINLIPLINTSTDVAKGKWKLQDGVLLCEGGDQASLFVPYHPPEEYDFRIVFTRIKGDDGVGQHLSANGHVFHWFMGVDNKMAGFGVIGGRMAGENATTLRQRDMLMNGRHYESVVKVRRKSIAAYVDGRLIAKAETDPTDLSRSPLWPDSGGRLGVGSQRSPIAFYAIEVTEITGQGKLLRPAR